MNYLEWQTRVKSAMGRSDVPLYVYDLAQSSVNRDMRLIDMEAMAVIKSGLEKGQQVTVAPNGPDEVALPLDYGSMISVSLVQSGRDCDLHAIMPHKAPSGTGTPSYYTITDGLLVLHPGPAEQVEVSIRYIQNLDKFTGDQDTNAVIARYPDMYLYGALVHAAVWAKDADAARTYDAAFIGAMRAAEKDDRRRRVGTVIHSRSARF